MSKGTGGTLVKVKVKPLIRQGNDTICSIEPGDPASEAYVQGGVINLQPSGTFDLSFEIVDGDVQGLEFDGDPFWCTSHACPGGPAQNQYFQNPHVSAGNKRVSNVTAVRGGGRNAYHYSLNFSDGSRYDPIIINS